MTSGTWRTSALTAFAMVAAVGCGSAQTTVNEAGQVDVSQSVTLQNPLVVSEVARDVSPALRDIPPVQMSTVERIHENGRIPRPTSTTSTLGDALVSRSLNTTAMPTAATNWAGLGSGFSGPQGTFSVASAPPDTDGDVGPNHYVQIVNSNFAVFNKTGTVLYGPVATSTLWSGFSGGCSTNNDGDGVVRYDRMADRWVISQFSVSTTPYLQCVAVSTTNDPTGSYYRYAFQYSDFNDYPKMGLWPDAYYFTFNMFAGGSTFSGAQVCAYDRSKMLTGAAATMQCFSTGTTYGGLLASDLDGTTLPPSGSPNYIFGLGATSSQIAMWKFHVDWTTPANSTFTGPTAITVASYTELCNGGTCVPQAGTTQQLDSLADRLMNRVPYRNFGDHEALLVTHSVTAGSSGGMRWYEFRSPSAISLFQSGTYAPDSNYRWMGSAAFDHNGDVALGFSVSGSAIHPGIHFTGRLAGDAAGTMSQGESVVIDGAGSQSGQNLSRWGDYSSMNIDPSDDCTFWYTDEYEASTGAFNWSTRIASFKFPNCGTTATNDFSISASPASLSLVRGNSGTSTISTATTSGTAQTVNLSVSGVPSGATATFSPTSVTSGGSSTLTINSGTAAAGSYTLTVTGTGTSATHTTSIALTITAPATNDFSMSASPASLSLAQNTSGTSTIGTTTTSGSAQTVNLSVSGVPAGATASLSPTSVTSGASSTLTVNAGTAAAGTYTLTVTGTGTSATHTTTVSLTVTAPATGGITNGGFETGTLSGWTASGASASVVTGGHSGTYAARVGTTTPTNGDSSVAQTFTVPTGNNTLSFFYKVVCPDTVTYDWATATLADNTAGTTSTVLAKVCSNTGAWSSVSVSVTAGHSYTLTLTSHDDNYSSDPTYTLYDDVALSGTTPPPSGITNGGFETGTFSGWTAAGASTAVVTGGHSGTYAARLGNTTPTNGDSSVAQTFTAPTGTTTLSFFYKVVCPDTVTYDWATATLKDNTAGTTTTVLAKTCSNTGAWASASASVTAGHSYTLTLVSHDDNYSGDPTYTLYDDVTVQ